LGEAKGLIIWFIGFAAGLFAGFAKFKELTA